MLRASKMALAICGLCSLLLILVRAQLLLGLLRLSIELWTGQSEIMHGLSKESIRDLECFLSFLWSAHGSTFNPPLSQFSMHLSAGNLSHAHSLFLLHCTLQPLSTPFIHSGNLFSASHLSSDKSCLLDHRFTRC
jgi:hypothetical protein